MAAQRLSSSNSLALHKVQPSRRSVVVVLLSSSLAVELGRSRGFKLVEFNILLSYFHTQTALQQPTEAPKASHLLFGVLPPIEGVQSVMGQSRNCTADEL